MQQKFVNKKIDYKFSEYYRVCDNINKYNLNSFFDAPSIKQITFELPLENTLKAFVLKTQYSLDKTHVLSLLFVYIISNVFPYINYNKSNSLKLINKNGYCLKINFNNYQEIFSFLHNIYDKLTIEMPKIFEKTKNQKYYIITKFCNADIFFELKNIIDKYLHNINIKELYFLLKFKFFKSSKLKFNINLIQNFPFLNK